MNDATKHGKSEEEGLDANMKTFETIEGTVYNPARRWKRIVAALIDGVLVSILSALIERLFAFGVGKESVTTVLISLSLSMIISFTYWVAPTYKYQATPGKMLFGLKVVNVNEAADLSFVQVMLREVLYKFIGFMFLMIGYLYFFFNKDARALHDIWGKTIVVEEE